MVREEREAPALKGGESWGRLLMKSFLLPAMKFILGIVATLGSKTVFHINVAVILNLSIIIISPNNSSL